MESSLPYENRKAAQAELAEKKSSRPGELAEFLVMVGLYHHLRQNIDMYKASTMLSERRKEGKVDT